MAKDITIKGKVPTQTFNCHRCGTQFVSDEYSMHKYGFIDSFESYERWMYRDNCPICLVVVESKGPRVEPQKALDTLEEKG